MKVLVAQLCPTVCDPIDCSPPDSSVHGILQVKILEWVAFPGDLPNPRINARFNGEELQVDPLPSEPPGKPICHYTFIQTHRMSPNVNYGL